MAQASSRIEDIFHKAWFAIQVRPGSENTVSLILHSKGYEQFLPTHPGIKGGHAKAPLFPGYVFCRITSQTCGKIVTTPGVVRIVAFGNMPAPIPDTEIEGLRTTVASGLPVEPYAYGHAGQKVRICQGPLRGVEGTIMTPGQKKRSLLVSIALLQRSVAVEIDPEWMLSEQAAV